MTAVARVTGGETTSSLPVNVKDHAAVGNGTADDTAAFNAAIVAAGGGSIFVPPGTYNLTGEITLTDNCGIFGVDPKTTALAWKTDLGTNKWGIRTGATGAWGGVIRNLSLLGPGYWGAGVAYGVRPANMNGIASIGGMQVEWCRIEGFNAGISIYHDHEEIRFCHIGGNFDGIRWADGVTTAGDQVLDSIQFDNNKRSGICVGGSNSIGGCRFSSLHIGNCPYGIYGETPGGAGFLNGLIMDDCAFEGFHNGVIYAEPGGTGAASRGCFVTLRSTGEGSSFVSPVGGLTTAAGQIDVPGGVGIDTDNWPSAIVTDTLVKSGQTGYITYSSIGAAVTSATTNSKPIAKLAGVVPTRSQYHALTVLNLFDRADLSTYSQYSVVGGFGSDSVRGLAAGVLPRGVALTAPPGVTNGIIPIAVQGVVNVLSDDATLNGASYYVKLDGTTGKVIKATGPTDGTVVGVTVGNQGSAVVPVRLMGLL